MITQITGKLLEKTPTYVVIECNGIGYKINISLQTFSSIKDENCKLFTHLSVKEDSHTLYGFYDQGERHLFRNLVSVSGVGPSTAQVILSTYDTSEIVSYIATADVAAIQHVKGIGVNKRKALLNYFGGLQEIKNTSIDELKKVVGINLKLATKIQETLKR